MESSDCESDQTEDYDSQNYYSVAELCSLVGIDAESVSTPTKKRSEREQEGVPSGSAKKQENVVKSFKGLFNGAKTQENKDPQQLCAEAPSCSKNNPGYNGRKIVVNVSTPIPNETNASDSVARETPLHAISDPDPHINAALPLPPDHPAPSSPGIAAGDNNPPLSQNDTTTTPNDLDVSSFSQEMEKKRKRNRKPNKLNWNVEVQKMKRMKGEEYLGYTKKNGPTGKRSLANPRKARSIGPTCQSPLCKKSSRRHCYCFTKDEREEIFNIFWDKLSTWELKRSYVRTLIDEKPKERTTSVNDTVRADTFLYQLKRRGQSYQVCQKMFLSTLGIGKKQVRLWVKGKGVTRKKRVAKIGNKEIKKKEDAEKFILSLPVLPSHYCRRDSSKLYLEPEFTTKTQLYDTYKQHCNQEDLLFVCRFTFLQILDIKNIAIYKPRNDQCDLCCSYRAKNTTEEEYQKHILLKHLAREQKISAKPEAILGVCHIIAMDVESVQLSPRVPASVFYYRTKLVVHNFSIFNLANKDACCYWWNEYNGTLVASTFATCIIDFIDEKFKDNLPIIIFSDGCTNQNRNNALANALLSHAVNRKKIIIQKFLEKGHTQMEVDSVYSVIEASVNWREIYHPEQYVEISKKARKTGTPYEAKYLTYDFFKDYSNPDYQSYSSIRPGDKTGDPVVTDIRQLKYDPDGFIHTKLDHSDEWTALPRNPKPFEDKPLLPLYKEEISIPLRKYEDLQCMLTAIPPQYHEFYKNLPHEE